MLPLAVPYTIIRYVRIINPQCMREGYGSLSVCSVSDTMAKSLHVYSCCIPGLYGTVSLLIAFSGYELCGFCLKRFGQKSNIAIFQDVSSTTNSSNWFLYVGSIATPIDSAYSMHIQRHAGHVLSAHAHTLPSEYSSHERQTVYTCFPAGYMQVLYNVMSCFVRASTMKPAGSTQYMCGKSLCRFLPILVA
jgi:hypothetical protein